MKLDVYYKGQDPYNKVLVGFIIIRKKEIVQFIPDRAWFNEEIGLYFPEGKGNRRPFEVTIFDKYDNNDAGYSGIISYDAPAHQHSTFYFFANLIQKEYLRYYFTKRWLYKKDNIRWFIGGIVSSATGTVIILKFIFDCP